MFNEEEPDTVKCVSFSFFLVFCYRIFPLPFLSQSFHSSFFVCILSFPFHSFSRIARPLARQRNRAVPQRAASTAPQTCTCPSRARSRQITATLPRLAPPGGRVEGTWERGSFRRDFIENPLALTAVAMPQLCMQPRAEGATLPAWTMTRRMARTTATKPRVASTRRVSSQRTFFQAVDALSSEVAHVPASASHFSSLFASHVTF